MNKRETEAYFKNVMNTEAPDEVWNNIQNAPITVKVLPEKKTANKSRYFIAAGAVVCAVAVTVTAAVWQNGLQKQPSVTGEPTLQVTSYKADSKKGNSSLSAVLPEESEPAGEPSKAPQSEVKKGPTNDIAVPVYKVWNHRFYKYKIRDVSLTENEIGEAHSEIVNGETYTVYSVKGRPLEEALIWKSVMAIHYYTCIDDGIFTVNGQKYGLVDFYHYYYPRPEKGKYLGEAEGLKVYEFVGNPKAVLIDMGPVIDRDMEKPLGESLYAAERIEE